MTAASDKDVLLKVDSLSVSYGSAQGAASACLALDKGESLAIVGESGSGKTTLLRSIARLLHKQARIESGSIEFSGRDLVRASLKEMRALRGSQIAYVFQSGQDSLDPLFKVGRQFDEVLRAHGKDASRAYECDLLSKMGIEDPSRVLGSLPSELSGGQCQRAAIALAVACGPKLLLADEPTSALDVDAQARVEDLLNELNRNEGISMMVVTHDIEFAARIASRIAVMRDGRIIETGKVEQITKSPSEEYTRKLIDSVPRTCREFRQVEP